MDDPFHKLQLSTLSHDLSDPSSIDGAGWRSAGVPRIHPLTGDRKEGKKHLKEWITPIVMCTKRQILLENSLGVFYLLCVQTLELNVPLLLTGWQRKVDCTCRNHRQWTHPWAHPSVESSGAPSPLQHTHTHMYVVQWVKWHLKLSSSLSASHTHAHARTHTTYL